jgi:hypothetical protein
MLKFIKKIDTIQNSIFYSFLNKDDKIIGYGRLWDGFNPYRTIINVSINNNFEIINYNDTLKGEDPRIFEHNNEVYIVDNYLNDIHLYNLNKNINCKINLNGKNFSFISHNNELYFIYTMRPFILCKVVLKTGNVIKINVNDFNSTINLEYRGGTPGYKNNNKINVYYGFGHRTYFKDDILKHDIFKWIIDFNNKPSLEIIDIEKPSVSKNISDPTCVIIIENKTYLVTAESDEAWFKNQDYITNVYEIS